MQPSQNAEIKSAQASGLAPQEFDRYVRQLAVPELGVSGQQRLKTSKVAVVGAGGLGSPVLSYLAAAGVGTLTIIDNDIVAESNLHRQPLHGHADLDRRKVDSATSTLERLNPDVRIIRRPIRLTGDNALELLAGHNAVVDGGDNFDTHYCLDDAAAELGIPCVWGSVLRWQGQTGVSWAKHGPRYRDLYPVPSDGDEKLSCATGGVIGTVCGVIGSIMATEAVKLLAGIGSPQLGSVLFFDGLDMSFRRVAFRGVRGAPAATDRIQVNENGHMRNDEDEIEAADLATLLADGNGPTLIDVREPDEHAAGAIAGSRLVPLSSIVTTAQRANQEGGPGNAQQRIAELVAPLLPEQPAILYCEHGVRSAHALAVLRQCGFTQLRHLDGGYAAWHVHAHGTGTAG